MITVLLLAATLAELLMPVTANAFDEDVQRSMQAGMNAHINKPVEPDRLIRILGELIYESEEKMTGQ